MKKVKAKYFIADSQENCIAAATSHFGVEASSLFFEVKPTPMVKTITLLAIKPGRDGLESIKDIDGFFDLRYTEEGVVLELFAPIGNGSRYLDEKLSQYIVRKNINDLNQSKVDNIISHGWGREIIAPPQDEIILDEDFDLVVDNKDEEGFIYFLAGDFGGKALDYDLLIAKLAERGIVSGLLELALRNFIKEKQPYKRYLIAKSQPPIHGKNGYLTYHVDLEKKGKPKIDDKGIVHYRELDLFENVKAGQLLISRKLATLGLAGKTIKGQEIKANPGKDVKFPKGKNIYVNEAETELYAELNGMIVYANNTISVSDVHTLRGNADLSTGNIDFDGSILIAGNVLPGMVIKASGNIEIGGVVESATIISGGDIVLRRGIQGLNKGLVEAAGNVFAGYIERATIIADGSITANTVAHSNLEAGNHIILKGKNSSIVGGRAMAAHTICAKTIGSIAEAATEVGVGMIPKKRNRLHQLYDLLRELNKDIEKLTTIKEYFARMPELTEEQANKNQVIMINLDHNLRLLNEYNEEVGILNLELQEAAMGRINVVEMIHPGVKIAIASAYHKVVMPTPRGTFRLVEGEVSLGHYEGE